MTQYYEAEANRLERLACETNDHAEQSRLWAAASRIGTIVLHCHNGGWCDLEPDGTGCECD